MTAEKIAKLRRILDHDRDSIDLFRTTCDLLDLAEVALRLREAAMQLRGVLAPLLKDYCELHDNETKHELFGDPAESALDTTSWIDASVKP